MESLRDDQSAEKGLVTNLRNFRYPDKLEVDPRFYNHQIANNYQEIETLLRKARYPYEFEDYTESKNGGI